MVSQLVKITNPTGFDLNPAGRLCNLSMSFKSKVTFVYGKDSVANAKSMLSVLGACIKAGDEITLQCEGEDEKEALEKIAAFIESGLEV